VPRPSVSAMNTNTRSITPTIVPFGDSRLPANQDTYVDDLLEADLDEARASQSLPAISVGRTRLIAEVDEFACTPSGRRVLHEWGHHELLTDALELIAERLATEPLLLAARDLAAAFGTDLFRRLSAEPYDLCLLPEMIAAFVPYAHAVRGARAPETAASLTVIEQCRDGYLASLDRHLDRGYHSPISRWSQCDGPEPWRSAPEPSPLERLATEVGGAELLDALTAEPLPEEPPDVSGVPADIRDRVLAAIEFADPVAERVFGLEVRTAVRRLLVDGAIEDPDVFRRKGRIETAGAGACLAVAQANRLVRPHTPMTMKAFAEHFGVPSAPTSRADTLRHAVTGVRGWSTSLRSPRYLTSQRKAAIISAGRRLRGEQAVGRVS
jgi:hypothetical protein